MYAQRDLISATLKAPLIDEDTIETILLAIRPDISWMSFFIEKWSTLHCAVDHFAVL